MFLPRNLGEDQKKRSLWSIAVFLSKFGYILKDQKKEGLHKL